MNGKELEGFLEKRGWDIKAEKALDLTEQVLIFLHDKMEKEEPFAVIDIKALEDARTTVALYYED